MVINKENIRNNRLVRHLYYFLHGLVFKKRLIKSAKQCCELFEEHSFKVRKSDELYKDMARMKMLYGFDFDEYHYFHFPEKTKDERLEFIADWEHLGYTCSMNDPKNALLFDDKWKTYQKYKYYYKRDVLLIEGQQGRTDFLTFLKLHAQAVVKPLNDSCGHGVKIIEGGSNTDDDVQLFDVLMQQYQGRFLVEEKIVQADMMAGFHASSVNTVRVTTIRTDTDVLIVHPFVRFGRDGASVDNGGSGGIMCTVDAGTGTVIAAADEFGEHYLVHPNSNQQIVGFTVPRWNELTELAKEVALIVPENRYTGWDFALTDKGWIMVEANRRGQFVGWQIPTQIGFRKELNSIMKQMRLHY